jgi:hypothetical protein
MIDNDEILNYNEPASDEKVLDYRELAPDEILALKVGQVNLPGSRGYSE